MVRSSDGAPGLDNCCTIAGGVLERGAGEELAGGRYAAGLFFEEIATKTATSKTSSPTPPAMILL